MAGASAVITGASGGIGRAIAIRLASRGYHLLLLGRDRDRLADVAEHCRANERETHILAGDLGDPGWLEHAAATARDLLGAPDVLVNNAGSANRAAVQDADMQAWQAILDVNFSAALRLTHALLPPMIARGSGAIINISSISGRHTNAGGAIYCASKHAMNGFSGCLFEDVREHGIKVSSIMPGFVDTALTAALGKTAHRMIQPDDVADALEYILGAAPTCCPTEIVLRPQRQP